MLLVTAFCPAYAGLVVGCSGDAGMKLLTSIALLFALSSTAALAKDKKKAVLPAVFSNARYVYVQAEDGDATFAECAGRTQQRRRGVAIVS